jgi:virginiamycin B lyase
VRLSFMAACIVAGSLVVGACGNDTGDDEVSEPLGDATLWVARSGCENVTRLDETGRVEARVDVGCQVRGVATGAGAVWFSTDTGSVVRVDPSSNRVAATIRVGTRVGAIAVGAGDVWVSELDAYEVVRIDAATNQVAARIPVGSEEAPVVGLVADESAVWAIEDFSLGLVQIDPNSDSIKGRVPLCERGECAVGSLAVGLDRAWVIDCCSGEVLEVDPETLSVTPNAQVSRGVWELTGDANGVWALGADGGMLARLEPDRTEPAQLIETDVGRALYPEIGAGSVWFYDSASAEIVRIGTEEDVVSNRLPFDGVRAFAVRSA